MNLSVRLALGFERWRGHVEQKFLQVENHRIAYLEGGRGETILMLHGFAGSSDNWNRLAHFLTRQYHVVAPDLAGWGMSTRLPGASYAIAPQVERVKKFADLLRLKRFHLVGNSMGGYIANVYAARYPAEVRSVGLICPFGAREPRPSELARELMTGRNDLVVGSVKDLERLLDFIFVKRPYYPKPVLKYFAQRAVDTREKTLKIFEEIKAFQPPLDQIFPQIKAPVWILWGERDRVTDVSGAEVYRAALKGALIEIMPNVGHVPMMERPRETAKRYLAFLRQEPAPQPETTGAEFHPA